MESVTGDCEICTRKNVPLKKCEECGTLFCDQCDADEDEFEGLCMDCEIDEEQDREERGEIETS